MDLKMKMVVVFALSLLIGTAFLSMFTADGSRNSLDDAHVEETVAVKWPYVRHPGSPTVPMSYYFMTDNGVMLNYEQAVMMGLSRKDVWVQDREGDPLGRYSIEERDDGLYDLDVWVEDDARIEMEGLTERPDDLLVRIGSEISPAQREWYSMFRDMGLEKQFDNHEHFVTDVVWVESVEMDRATLTLPLRGEPGSVWYSEDFDLMTFSGPDWEATRIPFTVENEFVTFEVDGFSAYAVSDRPMPEDPRPEHWAVDPYGDLDDEPVVFHDANDPDADKSLRIIGPDGEVLADSTDLDGGPLFVSNGEILEGSGTIEDDVVIDGGTFSPGNSPGLVTIEGDLTISNGDSDTIDDDYTPPTGAGDTVGTLYIEIGGDTPGPGTPTDDGYDEITVEGDITLGGKLIVDLINSYDPDVGETFDFLLIDSGYTSTSSVSGDFSRALRGQVLRDSEGHDERQGLPRGEAVRGRRSPAQGARHPRHRCGKGTLRLFLGYILFGLDQQHRHSRAGPRERELLDIEGEDRRRPRRQHRNDHRSVRGRDVDHILPDQPRSVHRHELLWTDHQQRRPLHREPQGGRRRRRLAGSAGQGHRGNPIPSRHQCRPRFPRGQDQ